MIEDVLPEPSGGVLQTRAQYAGGNADYEDVRTWQVTTDAARLLEMVKAALDDLEASNEPVEHFRASVPAWHFAVYEPQIAWNQRSDSRDPINRRDVDMLKALGSLLNRTGYGPTVLEQTSVEDVATAADALADVVANALIDNETKARILRLVTRIRNLVSDGTVTDPDAFVSAANELVGSAFVVVINREVDEGVRSKVFDAIKSILYGVAGNFATDGARSLTPFAAELAKAITS